MLDGGQIEFWIEAKFFRNLINVVERNDGGKFPTKFLQNYKFPILKSIFTHYNVTIYLQTDIGNVTVFNC